MIDLEAIEKECQQMIADGLGFIAPKSCGNAEVVAALVAELRKASKDANRYRWLRDAGCFEGSADDLFHATPAETDAEFDRFMQCEQ